MRRRPPFLAVLPFLLLLLPSSAWGQAPITDLAVIYGGSSNIACPGGFEKLGVDLNQGAGGDYIYLCIRRGAGAPITGFTVAISGSGISVSPDPRWTLLGVDLNRNAGGYYVYAFYSKDPGLEDPAVADPEAPVPDCRTLRDIVVLQGSQATPPGYTKLPYDLNRGTDDSGTVLYFAYKEE